ncbi:MAG: hypothetical protein K1X42_01075 [Opitutaceae bacterium]|nr:hypothetical protein [Opitutaceae bacterium]
MKPMPLLLFIALAGATSSSFVHAASNNAALVGAWRLSGTVEQVLIVTPDYWSHTWFEHDKHAFIRTQGGSYTIAGDSASIRIQFDSKDRTEVGKHSSVKVAVSGDSLTLTDAGGVRQVWVRVDDGKGPLAGTWRITGRHTNGKFSAMPLRARRTLKILSGTWFQWIAINVETGEFSGTGGGTYTFKDGKYVEHIGFFSRDNSRVGASLEFSGEVTGDTWRHRGRSSKGDPLDETWSRFNGATP